MSSIDELYLREKHNGLKYYDTLRLTYLLHIEYLYSHNDKSKKCINDLVNELGLLNYNTHELKIMIDNARNVLRIKYDIEVINTNPLCYKKKKGSEKWKPLMNYLNYIMILL